MGKINCVAVNGFALGLYVTRSELELWQIQTHMGQMPLLWVEACEHAVHKRSGRDGVVLASAFFLGLKIWYGGSRIGVFMELKFPASFLSAI